MMSLRRESCIPFWRICSLLLSIGTDVLVLSILMRLVEGLFDKKIVSRDPDLETQQRLNHLAFIFLTNTSHAILLLLTCLQNILTWISSITLSRHILSWSILFSFASFISCLIILWQQNVHKEFVTPCFFFDPVNLGICLFASQTITSYALHRLTRSYVYSFNVQSN